MTDKSYGQILLEGIARAIPWALVFSLTFLVTMKIFMAMLGQEVTQLLELLCLVSAETPGSPKPLVNGS